MDIMTRKDVGVKCCKRCLWKIPVDDLSNV